MQGIGYTTEHDVLRWLLEQAVSDDRLRCYRSIYLTKELYEEACKIAGMKLVKE